MAKKEITFQAEKERRLGLLMDEAENRQQFKKWAEEDDANLRQLCQTHNIEGGPQMYYQLALALARELYPEPKKRGRKLKWTPLNKGALVVEVERLVRPNDSAYGVEWACKLLAKREPWKSFIEAKEEGTFGPDPTEALRQIYFDFRGDKWAEILRKAFNMYEHENAIEEWERCVIDFVRNPHPN